MKKRILMLGLLLALLVGSYKTANASNFLNNLFGKNIEKESVKVEKKDPLDEIEKQVKIPKNKLGKNTPKKPRGPRDIDFSSFKEMVNKANNWQEFEKLQRSDFENRKSQK